MFGPRTVFLDLETTGLSPRDDAITEIGAVIVDEDGERREWSTLVRPHRPIPPAVARMTGITNEMVRDAPAFAAVADELATLLEDAVLVAHNARFDYAFLKQAFAREGRAFFAPTLCTALGASLRLPCGAGEPPGCASGASRVSPNNYDPRQAPDKQSSHSTLAEH